MAKAATLSAFAPLPECAGIFVATKGNLRCTAIALARDGLCLFSPVAGLSAAARSSLDAIGDVTHLFAPNHYHNLGIAEYATAFPRASLCASPKAVPRLEKVTGLAFADLADLTARLPPHLSLVEPDGLRTGEVWLRAKTSSLTAWFVVDAIAGASMANGNSRFDHPTLLRTFPRFGVRDKKAYVDWFARQLAVDQPQLVVPCHGGIIASSDLPQKLKKLQDEAFGS
jgi:hypothetical protein